MFTEHTIPSADGISLYYREYNSAGKGHPVLCLPGITRNSADFHLLAEHLAEQGRRVVCLDYRGRGRSAYDPNWRNYRPMRLLRDVAWALHKLRLKPVVVIGTSLGGLLTMGLAALHPGLVSSAVINDIGPDVNNGGVARIAAYIGHRQTVDTLEDGIEHLKLIFRNIGINSEEEWTLLAEGSFRKGPDGLYHSDWDPAIARTMTGAGRTPVPLWLVFRALRRTPTLVIRGGNSDVLTLATFDRMAEVKPDLMRLVIPNAGHTPTLNEPEAREAIDRLLEWTG